MTSLVVINSIRVKYHLRGLKYRASLLTVYQLNPFHPFFSYNRPTASNQQENGN